MEQKIDRNKLRKQRHFRNRGKLLGTPQRPRVSVFKSNSNIMLQLIDDSVGRTICAASTTMKEVREKMKSANANMAAAKELGALFAEKIKQQNINAVVFDRSGYRYHGKIKAIADSLREAKIQV